MSYIEKAFPEYRCIAEYALNTNDFPRDYKGRLTDEDIYVKCAKGVKVFYYGHGVFQAYIPTLQKGRNILRNIYIKHINPNNAEYIETEMNVKGISTIKKTVRALNNDLFEEDLIKLTKTDYIFDVEQTDEEVLFKFKDTSLVADYLEPSTLGAGIKAHSTKNLPKSIEYEIPEKDLKQYEYLVKNVEPLVKAQLIRGFIASLATKRNPANAIQSDMKLKRLKGLAYIHSIGKWDRFITYVKKNA